jgi:hypothetical protein
MRRLNPDTIRFTVSANVISETEQLLSEPGVEGFEGSVVWIGTIVDGGVADITRVHRPAQVAYATSAGLAVEITEEGLTALIRSLGDDEVVLGRLHTHGNGDCSHSETDDQNVVVAHPGAFSIVIPWFAAEGIDLARCGVHLLTNDHRWRRLSGGETRDRFTVR